MNISLIRGAFANPFELQNFYPLQDKHHLQVITSHKPLSGHIELPQKKLYSYTDVPDFPYKYSLLNRLFSDAHYLVGLEKALEGCDIAHAAETYYAYTVQAVTAKYQGIVKKVVSTVWENIPHNNETLPGRKTNKEISLQGVDHFIAVTSQAKAVLEEEGVDSSRITVIPMGVDLSRFTPVKSRNQVLKLLFVGRLVSEKGIEEVVTAFKSLRQTYPRLTLDVYGRGPLASKLPHLPGLSFRRADYQDMPSVYTQADILLAPSRTTRTWKEQYGMVLVEALASGLPIITTKSGAIPEVCASAAIYVPENDSSALHQQLDRLISAPDLRYNMGRAARRRAESHLSHFKAASRLSSVYENLIYEQSRTASKKHHL